MKFINISVMLLLIIFTTIINVKATGPARLQVQKDSDNKIVYKVGLSTSECSKNDFINLMVDLSKQNVNIILEISPNVDIGRLLSLLLELTNAGVNNFDVETSYGVDETMKKPTYISCNISSIKRTILQDGEIIPIKKTHFIEKYNVTYEENSDKPFSGVASLFHSNAQKREEKNYINGKLSGLYTLWYENGQKESETNYKDGRRDGLYTRWYDNGRKRYQGNYKNDSRNGLWTGWYENGQKYFEENYDNGEWDGSWTEWDENGKRKPESKRKLYFP